MLICYFSIWRERSARMAFFDMRTCPHIGPKLTCHRPGTKYCVDTFFYFRTLWNPPPLILFFLPLALRHNFSPWSLFFCQCSRLLFVIIPPYLGEYHASTSSTFSGTLAASSAVMAVAVAVVAAAEDAGLQQPLRRSCAIKLLSGRMVFQQRRHE